jgi:hypothetical protein
MCYLLFSAAVCVSDDIVNLTKRYLSEADEGTEAVGKAKGF